MLSTYDLPLFKLDAVAPELMPSAITDTISRYKLEAVEIGVNIAEEQGWTSCVDADLPDTVLRTILGAHHAGSKRHHRFRRQNDVQFHV